MIQLGEARACLVGGMESMSQAPHVIRGARSGFALGQGKLEDSLMVALLDTYCNVPMAGTAENLARKFEIRRNEQDEYALRSQQAAKRALDVGFFAEEIVPVEVKTRKGTSLFEQDDHLRPETTLEGLAKLRPAFSKDGFVTAGNARAAGARVVRHPYNKGNGAAVKSGLRAATGEVVLMMDADGQHQPEDVERVLAGIGEYDLVVGARTLGANRGLVRDLGNAFFNRLATLPGRAGRSPT